MRTTQHRILSAAAIVAWGAIVVGCAAPAPAITPPAATTIRTPTPTADASGVDTVPGYAVGEFPPVPLFLMPDISMLDSSLAGFAISLDSKIEPRPGLDIRPAACGTPIERAAAGGTTLLYGDGSGSFTGPDGSSVVNYGDGSGTFTANGVTAMVYGDGSGSYESAELSLWNYGDGSGSIVDAHGETRVYGDGSGSFEGGGVEHWNYGDGSAMYSDGTVEIWNHGDGAGSYKTAKLTIDNYGDGTGRVNGTAIKVDPLPPVAPVGRFPPLGAIAPITSCGTTITLADGVLFDFDKYDIRPEAAAVLNELAAAMNELGVPAAEISGHTDAIGSDADNQVLSERRAQAVLDALVSRGVSADLTAVGYGETVPVAPNEIHGVDNPAGRQLNRRVEIFIPAF